MDHTLGKSTKCNVFVFVPPEAVQDRLKGSTVSRLVLSLYKLILTQKFPEPSDRRVEVQIDYPDLPQCTYERTVPEAERRQNHIKEVDSNYTVVLDCLKE